MRNGNITNLATLHQPHKGLTMDNARKKARETNQPVWYPRPESFGIAFPSDLRTGETWTGAMLGFGSVAEAQARLAERGWQLTGLEVTK